MKRSHRTAFLVCVCLLDGFGTPSPVGGIELRQLMQCSSTSYVFCNWFEPALSPDGNWLAFTDGTTWPPYYEWWPAVVLSRMDGSDTFAVGVPEHNGWQNSPAWSPDGTRLVFVAQGWDLEKMGIWTLDMGDPEASESYKQLVNQDALDPAWTNDGASIVFVCGGGLWTVSSQGGPPTPLSVQGHSPSCGPEGEIVFEHGEDLWIREGDGSSRRLTDTPAQEATPSWSPAGTWIAFASDREGSWDIWVIASTGGTPVRLTTSSLDESQPSWSSDGTKIVYHAYDGATDSFWLASDLPDFRTSVQLRSWSSVKNLYR